MARLFDERQASLIDPFGEILAIEDCLPPHAIQVGLHDLVALGLQRLASDLGELVCHRSPLGMSMNDEYFLSAG